MDGLIMIFLTMQETNNVKIKSTSMEAIEITFDFGTITNTLIVYRNESTKDDSQVINIKIICEDSVLNGYILMYENNNYNRKKKEHIKYDCFRIILTHLISGYIETEDLHLFRTFLEYLLMYKFITFTFKKM